MATQAELSKELRMAHVIIQAMTGLMSETQRIEFMLKADEYRFTGASGDATRAVERNALLDEIQRHPRNGARP